MATKQPNRTLRDLRRAHGLTQAGLAERLSSELAARDINASPDARLVAAWESGEIQRPQAHYRSALRAALSVSSDSALGFALTQSRPTRVISTVLDTESDDLIDRAAFLRGVAAVAFSAALGQPLQPWLGVEKSRSVRQTRIGDADVAAIERITTHFAQWDMSRGGALSVDAAMGQLNWASTLLDQASFTGHEVWLRMCAAVANLAEVAGWSAYDAGLHAEARRALALGVHAAAEAEDWPLRAFILSDLARQSITLDQPHQALDLLNLAHYGAQDTATPATRAMLHVVTARAHAWIGDSQGCLRHVGIAEDTYASPAPADPPWTAHYIPAQLHGDSGCAVYDAATHDARLRPDAIDRLTHAAHGYGSDWPRSSALCIARASALNFDRGEPEQAATLGHAFADLAAGIASSRLAVDRTLILTRAAGYRHDSHVAALAERLSSNDQEDADA